MRPSGYKPRRAHVVCIFAPVVLQKAVEPAMNGRIQVFVLTESILFAFGYKGQGQSPPHFRTNSSDT